MSLHMIPMALSTEACDLIEGLLTESIDEHARWVEANGENRGDEKDIALAWKVLDELRVAKGHSGSISQRESRVQSEPRERTSEPPQSEAAAIADKMAKAARKAVDTHEEER
jgi:hypothetical protein